MLILLFFILSFFIGANGKHFVLVHGAFHGAWCWYKVATMLKLAGHNVTTIDLAGCGINPIQVQEIHSISKYYEPFMTFMESLPPKEKVILVGHSFGGIPLSVAMEKFPNKISVAVFITALVLSENLNFTSFNQEVLCFVFFSHLIYTIYDGNKKKLSYNKLSIVDVSNHGYLCL